MADKNPQGDQELDYIDAELVTNDAALDEENLAEQKRAQYRFNIDGLKSYAELAVSEDVRDQELLARVENRLAEFGDFSDRDQVVTFGSDTVYKLSKIGSEIIEYVERIDYAEFEKLVDEVVDTLDGANLEDLIEAGKKLSKDAANGTTRTAIKTVLLAQELASKLPVVKNFVPETMRQREERLKTETDKFLGRLPDMRKEIDDFEQAFEKEYTKLENLKPKIREFADVLLEAIDDLEVDIITIQEQARRADDEIIPAAEEKLQSSGRTLDQEELGAFQENAATLDSKYTDFMAQRSNSLNTLSVVKGMMQSLSETQRQLHTLHSTGVGAWRSNAAGIALTAAVRNSSRKVTVARDFSNKMIKAGADSYKNTALDIAKNSNAGAFDPMLVAEATKTYADTVKKQKQILLENREKNEQGRKILIDSQKDLQQSYLSYDPASETPEPQVIEAPQEKAVEPKSQDRKPRILQQAKQRKQPQANGPK